MVAPDDGWDTPDPVKVKALQCATHFCKGEVGEQDCVEVAKKFERYLRSDPVGLPEPPNGDSAGLHGIHLES